MTPLDWQADAACLGKHELFFAPSQPGAVGRTVDFDYGPALAICRQECEVVAQCRAWAIEAGDIDRKGRAVHGVVAGLLPTGKMPAPAARCGTEAGYKRHLRETGKACASCLAANRRAKTAKYERRAS